jgi:CRISPR-associated protein (TIGR02584 family)
MCFELCQACLFAERGIVVSHVLLSVTGMSPAVITETLFAIQDKGLPWPDRLVVITTAVGSTKLADLQHNISVLCKEYGCVPFSASQIEVAVITDHQGDFVSDARSVADHEALGDFIMQKVRDLTCDSGSTIHASIAGGRKTMTFYLGYAMSLFGRPGDSLSHVLVSEPFEQVPEFYFPRLDSTLLRTFQQVEVDASTARITLADIPFICLRDELSPAMLAIGQGVSFRDMVRLINLGDQEAAFPNLRLVLSLTQCELVIQDAQGGEVHSLALNTLDYAFYRTVVALSLEPQLVAKRPSREERDTDLAVCLAETLLGMGGKDYNDLPLTEMLAKLYELDHVLQISPRTLDALSNGGVNTHFFDTRCNSIREVITQALPPKLARWFVLRQVWDDKNVGLEFYSDSWPNTNRGGGYGIALRDSQVCLVDDGEQTV